MSKRGVFVVIEGLDRSGKSTQAVNLIKRLDDAKVPSKLIKFPGQCLWTCFLWIFLICVSRSKV